MSPGDKVYITAFVLRRMGIAVDIVTKVQGGGEFHGPRVYVRGDHRQSYFRLGTDAHATWEEAEARARKLVASQAATLARQIVKLHEMTFERPANDDDVVDFDQADVDAHAGHS
jgi:hypothetical protein